MTITVYYWPFLGRGASLVRMLEHTGTPYEYVSDKAKMAEYASLFGSTGYDTLAPPIVVDGDTVISQSVPTCLYLGKKLGLQPPGYDEYKAMQYCLDIVDTFEGNLGKNNENGATLKAFLTGDRYRFLMANIERSIKGPFYFGDQPSAVDFFLTQHMDWRMSNVFDPLKATGPYDYLEPYEKIRTAYEAIKATPGYKKDRGLKFPGPIKDEVLAAFSEL